MNCFDGVKAVIFVSALSDYDLTCYEDNETNRLNESLNVFDDRVNGNWFKDKIIFLIFNKLDIFRKKLKIHPLKNYFKNYEGGDDEEKSIQFITNLFLEKNKFAQDRIHTLVSCATDKESVANVLKNITKIMSN
jgi:GTPase SAR1 family protein